MALFLLKKRYISNQTLRVGCCKQVAEDINIKSHSHVSYKPMLKTHPVVIQDQDIHTYIVYSRTHVFKVSQHVTSRMNIA